MRSSFSCCGPRSGLLVVGTASRKARLWEGDFMGRGQGESSEGGFGVRRPLRFLVYKLGLDEKQIAELAQILMS